jgi:hypothetical protein
MAMLPRPIRAFECVRPIEIFRVVGRRPTDIWVDGAGAISTPGPDKQSLTELVYWRTATTLEQQLQERLGGLFVVTPEGACHPVSLSPPHPIDRQNPFLHAQTVRSGDEVLLESLIQSGDLVQVHGYRVMHHPSRPSDRLVAADHPLVVEERPQELDDTPVRPVWRARSARS